jgi:hypothetical protein
MTTNRERIMGAAAVIGGAFLLTEHEHRRLDADLDRHIAQSPYGYNAPPPLGPGSFGNQVAAYQGSPAHQRQQDRFLQARWDEVNRRAQWNANAQQQADRRRYTSPQTPGRPSPTFWQR